jgi:hypothetical protein
VGGKQVSGVGLQGKSWTPLPLPWLTVGFVKERVCRYVAMLQAVHLVQGIVKKFRARQLERGMVCRMRVAVFERLCWFCQMRVASVLLQGGLDQQQKGCLVWQRLDF